MDDEHPSSSLSREPDDWLVHGLPEEPPSLMKKYTTYYSSDHTYASWLPNGVCVVGLTASHPLLTSLKGGNQAAMGGEGVFEPEGRKRKRDEGEKEGKEDEEEKPASVRGSLTIDFEVGKKNGQGLRADLKESGKKAGQGLVLQPGSLLVKISVCAGGSGQMIHSMVRSPIAGKLLECNGALVKNPSLLCQAPEREGHLAVFYPSAAETSRAREKLLSKEAYDALLLRESERGVEGPAEMDPDVCMTTKTNLDSQNAV